MDAFSRHEVLDRIYVAVDSFNSHVLDHEAVASLDKDDPVRVAVEAASEALLRAYNAAGEDHLA